MNEKVRHLYIVGCGGMAKEIFYYLKERGKDVSGFIESKDKKRKKFLEVPVYDDEYILNLKEPAEVVIGIGSSSIRKKVAERYLKNQFLSFPAIISKSAVICGDIKIGRGSIIGAGSILTTDIELGDFTLINFGVSIGHDTVIGDFSTIQPGSNISGNVKIGKECEIGTGSKIIQGKIICEKTVTGAGTVIVDDITKDNCLVVGVPGRIVKENYGR